MPPLTPKGGIFLHLTTHSLVDEKFLEMIYKLSL